MKLVLKAKLFLYRLLSTKLGKIILNLLSFGVKAENLGQEKEKKYPFFVVITIDTESGYVDKNERRIWQKEKPEAFQGCYFGVRNLLNVFKKHNIQTTFFLSTQCFAGNKEYSRIKKQLDEITKNKHEIGLHLHADSDFALQKRLGKKLDATSAFFYNYGEKLEMIKAARDLINENLGKNAEKNLISFRWGNWALDSGGAKALDKAGFKIDSSAIPGIKGHTHDTMRYDWGKVSRHYPWKLSTINHQATNHDNSDITEVPIATFDFFGFTLRADPVNSLLLNKAFVEYYKKADCSKKPFPFAVITHSSEATYKDGKPTIALKDLDAFISYAKKFGNVKFATLRNAYEIIAEE